ncbi:MAG: ABC transporter permease [Candidatus Aenigmarchaeota archaeon ex4484_56]|nr:MAG: ABC transporter permease [Candidatus Aenigmarchaeota archaeon ex4484_56]
MIFDLIKFSFKGLTHRKLRSWLTILGIFIGISAVVGLISLSQGMQDAITKQFEELGTDKITIAPGTAIFGSQAAFTSARLREKDLETIKRVKSVESAAGMIISNAVITFRDEEKTSFITGIPLDENSREVLKNSQSFEILEGRDLKQGDKYKAIVGYDIAKDDFFSKEVHIRDKIIIGGKEFKVIGILNKIGNRMDDSTIVIPIDTAKKIFNIEDDYRMIIAKIKSGEEPSDVAEDIKRALRRERGLKEGEEDFAVETTEDLVNSFKSILGIISVVLIGVAAISLLVGGVGIMNTTYTSVLERTRDIGIMKAIGAKDIDILIIFLFESGFIGLVGGIIGCILGITFALIITQFASAAGYGFIEIKISAELILFAIGFSFIVGAISGILPARRASKLQPVEALREL